MNKLLILALALCIAACGNSKKKGTQKGGDVTIAAAGATFPLPYYNLAFKTYRDSTGVAVTYGGIGSGGGIRSLKDKIVDFGGSDAYLSDAELAEMPAEEQTVPTEEEKTQEVMSQAVQEPEAYTVQAGDTLLEICRDRYGNEDMAAQVCELNQLDDGDKIYEGQVILLP